MNRIYVLAFGLLTLLGDNTEIDVDQDTADQLLILEDFATFLVGGKSLFGRAFNEFFGPGGAKMFQQRLLARGRA